MSTWNYRIGTYIFDYKKKFPDNQNFHDREPERYFCVITGWYTNNILNSYSLNEKNILDGFDDISELCDTIEKIRVAFEKPVIDLDNFPNEYQEEYWNPENLQKFINNQKDLDPEFNEILNEHMMRLIDKNKPKKKRFDE